MNVKSTLLIVPLLIGASLSGKAQSTNFQLNNSNIITKTELNGNTLSATERETWHNKIKPYYGKLKSLKSQPVKFNNNLGDSLSLFGYGNIDEKMCLLVRKDTFVDTDFRMPTSSENIDVKMVYPKKVIKP